MARTANPKSQSAKRINFIYVLIGFVFLVFAGRLIQLQVLQHGYYSELASETYFVQKEVPAERGQILTWDDDLKDYYPLGTNVTLFNLTVVPNQVDNPDLTVAKLEPYLPDDVDLEQLKEDLGSDKPYLPPLRKKISAEAAEKIRNLELAGVHLVSRKFRYYPEGDLAASVLGFVNANREGQYGIEGYFGEQLKGEPGEVQAEQGGGGTPIALGQRKNVQPEEGIDVSLTIDRAVQYKVDQVLERKVEEYQAERGSVIIMEPDTGDIIAMAQEPSFNPNNYSEYSLGSFTNMNVRGLYEPGSVFKVLTMAMGIDLGVVSPSTTYVDTGKVEVNKETIRNAQQATYGEQNMVQVLEKSINTGAVFVAQKVGKRNFMKYLEEFGFEEETGIEVAGETSSNLRNPSKVLDVDLATMSFGQGLSVTPIALTRAVASIANGGVMPEPHIVSELIYPSGPVEVKNEGKRVLDKGTSDLVSAMMESVVENGHGERADVAGYRIAGKTGTAQVLKEDGSYSDEEVNTTFVGFAPVDDPEFVMLVRFDRPQIGKSASSTSAPTFSEIAEFLLRHMQVPPSGSN